MKALLLSISTGQGHHQCGMAIMDALKEKHIECEMIDALKYINPLLSESVAQGYLISTKSLPKAYGGIYRLAEKKGAPSEKRSMIRLTPQMLSIKLKKYITDYNPDIIICTHVFAAQLVTEVRNVSAKTIGVITDFTIHPFWEETNMDYYITANESLTYLAMKKGIPSARIKPYGIPINSKFSYSLPKQEARKQLGIIDKKTVLIMSGSMGFGNIKNIIRKLDKLNLDFQMIVVCGRNKKMKESIDEYHSSKTIYNHGYVDNVDVIMDASDVIITKPGGLTSSEALAKGLPIIMVNPIPGQEDRNVEFLLNHGVAMNASNTFPVDECLYTFLTNDLRQDNMSSCVRRLGRPNAAKALSQFISELEVRND